MNTSFQPVGCVEVEVDYDLTPAEIAKGYDEVNEHIKDGSYEAMPREKGKVTMEVCWFQFGKYVTTKEAEEKIEASEEFLFADLWELDALGTAMPDLRREFTLVALSCNSQWRDSYGLLLIPVIPKNYKENSLILHLDGSVIGGWSRDCCIVAVRRRK